MYSATKTEAERTRLREESRGSSQVWLMYVCWDNPTRADLGESTIEDIDPDFPQLLKLCFLSFSKWEQKHGYTDTWHLVLHVPHRLRSAKS